MLVRHEKLALRKYQAQKYFTGALTGQDVAFFEKHEKAIIFRVLEKEATPSELFAKHKEDFERARRCGMEDIVSQDFNVRTALLKLLVDVGYGGFDDFASEICLKEASELPDVTASVNKVQQLVGGTTKRNSTLSGVLKPWLLKYIGLKLQARQSGKVNRRSVYKMTPCPDITQFSLRKNTVYERVMRPKRAETREGTGEGSEPGGSGAGAVTGGGGGGSWAAGSGGGGSAAGTDPQTMDIRQFISIKRRDPSP